MEEGNGQDMWAERGMKFLDLHSSLGLRGKLIIPFVIMLLLSVFFLSATSIRTERSALNYSMDRRAETLAKTLASIMSDHIAMGEYDLVQKRIMATKEGDEDVAYGIVVGNDGACIAHTDATLRSVVLNRNPFEAQALLVAGFMKRDTPTQGVFEVLMPILYSKKRMGTLRLGITTKSVDQLVRKGMISVVSMSLIALLLGSGVYMFIARMLARPLQGVVERLEDLASGRADLTVRLSVSSRDEVGVLSSQFNAFLGSMASLVGQIRSSSDQIGGSSRMLFEITKESSEIVSGSVKVMSQIAEETGRVATNTQVISDSLQQMGGTAHKGGQLAQAVFEKTKEVQQSAAAAVSLILELGQCTNKIGSIIDVITKITNQTNLLSLNAAIEAARAGQAGLGFTVVADEIRRLADSSAQNAQKIYALIKEVQDKTAESIKMTRKASEQAEAGHKLTEEAAGLFVNIASEVEGLSGQMTQVAASTSQVAASTEEATAASEEHSASIEQVAIKSQELDQVVTTLRALVGQFKA